MGLSTNGVFVLLGGRTSVSWRDLTGHDHLEHQRRLDLGTRGSEPQLKMPNRGTEAAEPWSLKELCKRETLWASGLLSVDHHLKGLSDVFRSYRRIPVVPTTTFPVAQCYGGFFFF